MNLVELQDKLKRVPLPMLDAASKGQIPSVPPFLAATELAERQRMMQASQSQQQAAQAPQQTTTEAIKQGLSALIQQQANQQRGMQQLQQQMGQVPPVRAARGGLMSVARFAEGGDTALDDQARSDRERIARLLRAVQAGSESAGRAIMDIATLPVRGVAGAYDTAVVRPMRAAGANAAYLSPKLVPEGADPSSMTPFYDEVRKRDARPGSKDESEAETARLRRQEPKGDITSYTGTRLPPAEEAAYARAAAAGQLSEDQKGFWAAYTGRFPDAAQVPDAPVGRGLGSLTADAVAAAEEAPAPSRAPADRAGIAAALPPSPPGAWQERMADAYKQIGTNAPDAEASAADIEAMRAEAQRLAQARRGLFEAQKGGDFQRFLQATAAGLQGNSPGERALNALMFANTEMERQRMADPQFAYDETVADVETGAAGREAQAKAREAQRLYKEGAVKDRIGFKNLAQEELQRETQLAVARINTAEGRGQSTPAEIQLVERIAAEQGLPFSEAYRVVQGAKREPMSRDAAFRAWNDMNADFTKKAAFRREYPGITTFDQYYAMLSGSQAAPIAPTITPKHKALLEKYQPGATK